MESHDKGAGHFPSTDEGLSLPGFGEPLQGHGWRVGMESRYADRIGRGPPAKIIRRREFC